MKRLKINPNLCIGCNECELICSLLHEGEFNPARARIKVNYDKETNSYSPNVCRNCAVPKCKEACCHDALVFDERIGTLVCDENKCARCYACVEACSFSAIRIGPEGNILKCDLCGDEPLCVVVCSRRSGNSSQLMDNEEGAHALNYVDV